MIDLATDPKAFGCWFKIWYLVDGMKELLSDDCPDDLAQTMYARYWSFIDPCCDVEVIRGVVRGRQELARSICDEGFRPKSKIHVRESRTGGVQIVDGTHRASILKALGRSIPVEVEPLARCVHLGEYLEDVEVVKS